MVMIMLMTSWVSSGGEEMMCLLLVSGAALLDAAVGNMCCYFLKLKPNETIGIEKHFKQSGKTKTEY